MFELLLFGAKFVSELPPARASSQLRMSRASRKRSRDAQEEQRALMAVNILTQLDSLRRDVKVSEELVLSFEVLIVFATCSSDHHRIV